MGHQVHYQRSIIIAAAITVILIVSAVKSFAQPAEGISTAIEQVLKMGPARYIGAEGHGYSSDEIDIKLSGYYLQRDYKPLWVNEQGPNERARVLRSFLDNASAEGLNPEDYKVQWIDSKWESLSLDDLAKLEILLTLELSFYTGDIRAGRIHPKQVDPVLFASAREKAIDMAQLAKQALDAADLETFLRSQPPQHIYYKAMVIALARYREIEQKGGWGAIPEGSVLKPGMSDLRIPLVRKRLAITNDYSGADLSSEVYDNLLDDAVKNFQKRHYLNADGVIGSNTLLAMNIPVEKRIRQIMINMERWRWVSRNMEGKQIFVNIAGFHLTGFQDETLELRMPVIVGKEQHMSPVFSGEIKYAEFNPYWNVPVSIAVNEYLPQLQKNPNALAGKHIRIFSTWTDDAKEIQPNAIDWNSVSESRMSGYHLRQEPGPWNALGTVKFIFPNKYSVYLHDTPGHSLFQKEKRTFSHGCIRVSRPQELAVYLLKENDASWTLDRVNSIIQKKEREVIYLKKPIPVHILYRTAVATGDGTVLFGKDIYGRDELLEKALF